MKKILLIEDKPERQKYFLDEVNMDLSKYTDKVDNKIDDAYKKMEKSLVDIKMDTEKFKYDNVSENDEPENILENYTVICVHSSAFDDDRVSIFDRLEKHCEDKGIPLIVFSGANDNDSYTVKNRKLKILNLKEKTFYSKNLEIFLNDYDGVSPNVLMLSYGMHWKTSVYLNVLEKINLVIENNLNEEDIFFSIFKDYVQLNELEQVGYDYEKYLKIEDDRVYLDDIRILEAKLIATVRAVSDV